MFNSETTAKDITQLENYSPNSDLSDLRSLMDESNGSTGSGHDLPSRLTPTIPTHQLQLTPLEQPFPIEYCSTGECNIDFPEAPSDSGSLLNAFNLDDTGYVNDGFPTFNSYERSELPTNYDASPTLHTSVPLQTVITKKLQRQQIRRNEDIAKRLSPWRRQLEQMKKNRIKKSPGVRRKFSLTV
ncbi:hypothetical protein AB6A40_002581 [Gnathostoma spinigerum]|uniref:Uncharacterized protein n=1 Tax=Gnathostoma spinigerum TaxID=75299 RepID=A0ABD6EGR1_9BILA